MVPCLLGNRLFRSSPRASVNEVKCSAFDEEMIFDSHVNKTHCHKKGQGRLGGGGGVWNTKIPELNLPTYQKLY